jgi:hypothetical protein
MKTLTQLQQNRQIIQDFTMNTLAAIPSLYSRLAYVASLRDLSSGRYEHAGLSAIYPDIAVQQAVEVCHEQVFEKILETRLADQEPDLRMCLEAMQGGHDATVGHWQRMEAYRMLLPEHAPGYLKELFCSNLRAMLEIFQSESSMARSAA